MRTLSGTPTTGRKKLTQLCPVSAELQRSQSVCCSRCHLSSFVVAESKSPQEATCQRTTNNEQRTTEHQQQRSLTHPPTHSLAPSPTNQSIVPLRLCTHKRHWHSSGSTLTCNAPMALHHSSNGHSYGIGTSQGEESRPQVPGSRGLRRRNGLTFVTLWQCDSVL